MSSETHKTATDQEAPRITAEQAKLAAHFVRGDGEIADIGQDGKDSLAEALDAVANFNA